MKDFNSVGDDAMEIDSLTLKEEVYVFLFFYIHFIYSVLDHV